ncbi:CMRF35-like molecule 1 [Dromiciops gliroides]|uniref:CMRF35-like molecule 1 n=1 Tax=Dromiciops gliroides TaxID=33562 RepID=UPI001CC3F7FD|nr:CMRF35-like molecule 1 [Dromiciops gliroides]
MYLPSALLLLWLPGCFSDGEVWGPKQVNYKEHSLGIIQCQYNPGWENYLKWWCRGASWSDCKILVKTTESMETNDHVSIRDNATARIFTVTIKNIRKTDEDVYWCGIEKIGSDYGHQITVTVFSATTTGRTTTGKTTTNTRTRTTTMSTSTGNLTGMVNKYSYERFEITDLQVLLPIIFGILLVMLVGVSILAWRMRRKHRKEAEKLAEQTTQVPQQTEEGICYANLTLHPERTSRDSPLYSPETKASLQASSRINSIHSEVDYVTMASLKIEDISLSLDTPDQSPIYSNMEHPLKNPSENTKYSL